MNRVHIVILSTGGRSQSCKLNSSRHDGVRAIIRPLWTVAVIRWHCGGVIALLRQVSVIRQFGDTG